MATFVLVTGKHFGGWSWKKVTPLLRAAGHEVWTPTLTGLGERVHLATPDVDLDTHVTDVVNLLVYEDLCRRHARRLQLRRDGHRRGGGAGAGAAGATGLRGRRGAGGRPVGL